MIYDCFLFYRELDILDIRLHELDSVVDKFVLVESTVTHMNKPKPLYFQKNKERFKSFEKKIIHVVVKDSPDVTNPWILNDYQFSQMMQGLKQCKPNDVILYGDLDEIPKAATVAKCKRSFKKNSVFIQRLSYYYLNCMQYPTATWPGTHIIRYKDLINLKNTWIAKYTKPGEIIEDGGWHFSYMGGVKAIQEKISNMAHQEFNTEKYNTPEKILQSIYSQKDLFEHGIRFRRENVDVLPEYVQNHLSRFDHLILSPEKRKKGFPFLIVILQISHVARTQYRKIRSRFKDG